MLDVNFFDELRIGLATADDIRQWSHGEVKKPETINYRTLKPEKDGLFCEKIFGPQRDWECYCGKYKRVRFKGIICERCGVEVTRSKVRRERMGHIELAAPVTHIWYFKGVPSRLGYLLDLAPKDLEKIIYFASYVVTSVDAESRHRDLSTIENEILAEKRQSENSRDSEIEKRAAKLEADLAELEAEGAKADVRRKVKEGGEREMRQIRDRAQREIDRLDEVLDTFRKLEPKQLVTDELLYRELRDRFGEYFTGSMGAEAIKALVQNMDLDAEAESLRETIRSGKGQRKIRALKRLKVVAAFLNTRNSPLGMVLDCVPVIPPDLRPMVQLDGGRFATSDLNDLYRRVINRNNRLKRLIDLGAPEIIVNNEKRMLQEAVDALFDNGRRGRPVTGPGNRPLKSLSDMLKGKQGRFRQNLLGKRVDYSGRSVIVVGPTLKLHQCGLPKQMALELFKPFVMKALVDRELAQNIKSAKRMVERRRSQVWDVLEEVIKEHPVLLNRAPTLHRLGIQAFEPVLVGGKAIQIHPLVCTAFNADFDGDQMAVHLPLSAEAQAESRVLMLSANNVLSPAHGRPLVTPTQDMIIGAFYLTEQVEGAEGEGRRFGNRAQMERAYDAGDVNLHARVLLRLSKREIREEVEAGLRDEADLESQKPIYRESTVGRFIFNRALPLGFGFVDEPVKKKNMGDIVDHLARDYPKSVVQDSLDQLKNLCFNYASRSGLTISIDDVKTPPEKKGILDRYEKEAEKVESQFRRGIITDGERRQKEVEIWTNATDEVRTAMEVGLKNEQFNPIDMMVGSGARGNMMQVRQIAGMRGLVANPRGDMIPRPIKSNFREGLSMLEYFIATPGARKGLVDTALRTADSGYLTRRLVDVAQELIIREIDCQREGEPLRGVWVDEIVPDETGKRSYLETRIFGRALVNDVKLSKDNPHAELAGKTIEAGTYIAEDHLEALRDDPEVDRVRVRSVLTCQADYGVCATCYGRSLATGRLIELGEAVGVIAAQSIGEPGTQLTMRTFHTGGIAGSDIAGGLPRVVELFEARSPKGKATLSHISGVVRIADDEGRGRVITVVGDDGSEHAYTVPTIARLEVTDGQEISAGEPIVDGPRDPKELLEIKGVRETQQYLVIEVQRVYRDQGVSIHDKHIELIVRQMTRRVVVQDPGESRFLPGEAVDAKAYTDENKLLVQDAKTPAEGRPVMMGITKASLATESWLSAASFQETTRVLTEAAIESKSDGLKGLKENIIIGKLIPAGTGMGEYNDIGTEAPEYKPMEFWSSEREDQGIAEWLTGNYEAGAGEAPGNGGDLAAVVGLPSSGQEAGSGS